MKRLKIFSCLFVLLVLFIISVVAETPVSPGVQTDDREKDSTVETIIILARGFSEAGNFEEALKLLKITLEKFPQKKYREKLQIELADLHLQWAGNLEEKYDYTNAIKHFKTASVIFKNYTPQKTAIALGRIGGIYSSLGQNQKALEYLEKALPIIQAVGDRAGEATILHNIGKVYNELGQKQKALEFFEKALPISQAVGYRAAEANILNNIGAVYSALGQKQKALAYLEKALPISQALGDHAVEAMTLDNIGTVCYFLGQKQKALAYFKKSLLIYQAFGDRAREVNTLKIIGGIYFTLGQKQKALEYLEKANNR